MTGPKPLKDCEFTAFISYAHDDDVLSFDWITLFSRELERGLSALLRGVRLPRVHLSAANGPLHGPLAEQLRQRVAASFAMVIVVHQMYAQSDWCLRELQYFKELFGDQGLKDRLFIVALSESSILSVSGGSAWQQLLAGEAGQEQVWIPFFDVVDHDRPIDIYMGPGLVSPSFKRPFERMRGLLADQLRESARQRAAAPAVDSTAGAAAPSLAIAPAVLFGFVPGGAAAATAAAASSLAGMGLATRVLTQDAVFSGFADFDDAGHLVLAFDDSPALLTSLAPGGHLQLQRDAWLGKGRPAERLHWLDLRAPGSLRAEGSAAMAVGLGVQSLALAALAERLAPALQVAAAAPAAARVYIESNRIEPTVWETLGDYLHDTWATVLARIAPQGGPPLRLHARGLPLEQIDSHPTLDDADGVVLLWGKKTSEALVAQINKVENKLAPGRDTAPGIVAYLMPPQQSSEPVPAWGWPVLRFDASDEETIAVLGAERDELERFLERVYARHQQRAAAAAAGAV